MGTLEIKENSAMQDSREEGDGMQVEADANADLQGVGADGSNGEVVENDVDAHVEERGNPGCHIDQADGDGVEVNQILGQHTEGDGNAETKENSGMQDSREEGNQEPRDDEVRHKEDDVNTPP